MIAFNLFPAWRLKGKISVLYEILELRSSENLYPNPGKRRNQRDPASIEPFGSNRLGYQREV
jgi:hypothetical protein